MSPPPTPLAAGAPARTNDARHRHRRDARTLSDDGGWGRDNHIWVHTEFFLSCVSPIIDLTFSVTSPTMSVVTDISTIWDPRNPAPPHPDDKRGNEEDRRLGSHPDIDEELKRQQSRGYARVTVDHLPDPPPAAIPDGRLWADLSPHERYERNLARRKKYINANRETFDQLAIFTRALRLRLHLTQKELADILGCTEYTILRWEHGRSYPSLEMRMRLKKLEEDYPGGIPGKEGKKV